MLAVRSNERAASAIGINVDGIKVLMFAASGFIAGLGGCLIAYRFGSVSDVSFGTIASLAALAVAYLGGITSVSGAITSGLMAASGVMLFASSRLFGSVGQWEVLISGLLLIVITIRYPEGIADTVQGRARSIQSRVQHRRPLVSRAAVVDR
jgi:branched-chain amino acid transport system permease protein